LDFRQELCEAISSTKKARQGRLWALKAISRSQWNGGIGADGVVPDATPIGALSAQMRRPGSGSAKSAKRRFETSLRRLKCAKSGHSLTGLRAVKFNPTSSSSKAQAQLSAGLFGETGRAGLSDLSQLARRC
jgi:hypothetical protein